MLFAATAGSDSDDEPPTPLNRAPQRAEGGGRQRGRSLVGSPKGRGRGDSVHTLEALRELVESPPERSTGVGAGGGTGDAMGDEADREQFRSMLFAATMGSDSDEEPPTPQHGGMASLPGDASSASPEGGGRVHENPLFKSHDGPLGGAQEATWPQSMRLHPYPCPWP